MRAALTLAVTLSGLVACGDPDPGTAADAPPQQADAYDTARCLIQGDYGALGAVTGTAGTNAGATTITIVLDPGPPGKDDLFFKLVPGKGVFTGGVAAGTYPLAGVDTSFSDCGLCTNLIADITATGPSKFYFTDSGTVTFTSVTPPIAGSAQDLHFVEVDLNSGLAIPGGCTGTIASVSFSTP
jgi:hypothetical protein